MSDGQIADDEILYRRIPPGSNWFEPPDRVTSANFKLRPGEKGISVYRASVVEASAVLSRPDAISGSGIARATADDIRNLRNGQGEALDLDVVSVDDEDNPGHAEIRGNVAGRIPNSASRALARLFSIVKAPL